MQHWSYLILKLTLFGRIPGTRNELIMVSFDSVSFFFFFLLGGVFQEIVAKSFSFFLSDQFVWRNF